MSTARDGESTLHAPGRPWWVWALVAAIVVAGVVAGVVLLSRDGAGGDDEASDPPTFVEVVRTDLEQTESYEATLGTVAGDPIGTRRGGTLTASAASGETVVAGDVLFTVDEAPTVLMYGSTPAWRTLAPTEDSTPIASRVPGTITGVVESGTVLEEGDVAFWVNGEPVVVVYGTVPAYRSMLDAPTNLEGDDILQLETFLDASGFDDIGISVDGEFTSATESVVENWQEAVGATVDGVVDLGEVIFLDGPAEVISVDVAVGDVVGNGSPVMSLTGNTIMTGDDVRQLEENLVALGFDGAVAISVDGVFDPATRAAVERWEESLGVDVDGVVELGDVVFVDGAIRVGDRLAVPGASVAPGSVVLAVSSAEKVVTLDLPAEDQSLVAVGESVVVELPNGTDVPAVITEVANVASVSPQGAAVFEVTITLEDADAAGNLDQAPVDVEIVTDSVSGVMAVPVTALLALAEGGYAVEVETSAGGTRLVAVEPGFFAAGLVEIESDGVAVGDRVVVP